MKKGWQTKTLAEACQIKPPKSEARDKVSASSLVSFLPMEDMGIDVKFVRATQTKPLSAVVGSYTYFADGDVLLAKHFGLKARHGCRAQSVKGASDSTCAASEWRRLKAHTTKETCQASLL